MPTSRKMPFLSEVINGNPIPIGKLAYFRQRFRDRFYDLILAEFLKQEKSGLTKAEIARRIHRRPEQITRWLGAPGNWTLETVSDLLLAISKAEPEVGFVSLENRVVRNFTQPEWAIPSELAGVVKWKTPTGSSQPVTIEPTNASAA